MKDDWLHCVLFLVVSGHAEDLLSGTEVDALQEKFFFVVVVFLLRNDVHIFSSFEANFHIG